VKRGVNLLNICDQTGHKSLEMLRVYCRDAELFVGNAAAGPLFSGSCRKLRLAYRTLTGRFVRSEYINAFNDKTR
jgi:hypothetical protein